MATLWPGPEDYEAYCAPVKKAPPLSENEFVDEVIAERRRQGLAVDGETVRRAIKNSERPDYLLRGFFLTLEEQAELEAFDPELPVRAKALVTAAGGAIGQIAWCWLDGLRGLRVAVKDDVERYRALLNQEFGSDRVIVTKARYSEQELRELQERVRQDVPELAQLGIDVCSTFPQETGVSVQVFAPDRNRAMAQIAERYGPEVIPRWAGPSRMAAEPQTFGGWIADGNRLSVFYPLMHNGETPGSCTAQELPDRVIVTLTVLAPQGFRTAVGGFTPSHAVVELAEPLAERAVLDAAENVERPRWTGHPAGPQLSRDQARIASTSGRWLPSQG